MTREDIYREALEGIATLKGFGRYAASLALQALEEGSELEDTILIHRASQPVAKQMSTTAFDFVNISATPATKQYP